jgi:uncharacterized membrane protein YvlD (DUF360 family)
MEEGKPGGLGLEDAKGITPTVFGFLIAYLIPGLFGVITLGLYFDPVAHVLLSFSDATSSTGLSVLLFLTTLLVGLQLNIVRWAVFEELLLRKKRLKPDDIAKLRAPDKAAKFQVFLDQMHRYHQFAGAQSIVIPFFVLGVVCALKIAPCSGMWFLSLSVGLVVWGLTVWSAVIGWNRYVDRATALANAA